MNNNNLLKQSSEAFMVALFSSVTRSSLTVIKGPFKLSRLPLVNVASKKVAECIRWGFISTKISENLLITWCVMLCFVKTPCIVIILLRALMWNCFAVNVSDFIQPTPRRTASSSSRSTQILTHHSPRLISSIFVNSTSRTPLELLSSFNDHGTSVSNAPRSQLFTNTSGKRFTSTSCCHDGKTIICTVLSTISTALLAASSPGVVKNGNCSSVITNSSQVNRNLTVGKYLVNQTNCNGKDGCYRYGARWINFYVDVSIILCYLPHYLYIQLYSNKTILFTYNGNSS